MVTIMEFMTPFLFILFNLISASSGTMGKDYLPTAKNVTWSSHNFKTILTWGPKPINYTYTVEFSSAEMDKQRNPHCIRSTATECDLTRVLTDLKACYTAEVLSEPAPGMSTDQVEPPFTQSKKFCPYTDTVIGVPEFKIKLNENNTVILYISDQLTALLKDGRPQGIKEIFNGDLKYMIRYRKVGNTGEKQKNVSQDEVEMSELDKGDSYCFRAAVYLPSRKGSKKLSQWSLPKCLKGGNKSLIDEYGLVVIGSGTLVIIAVLTIFIIATVVCCKQRREKKVVEKSEGIMV